MTGQTKTCALEIAECERDAAVALGRELAVALVDLVHAEEEEYGVSNLAMAPALAKARAAGWLEGK